MKTMTIPPLRVSAQLRRQAEAVLEEGETLSSFMLDALQKSVAQRLDQQAFVARGLASAAKARRTGRYVSTDAVIEKLSKRLTRARLAR
ncbi:MAG: prevent-host-death protein [Deltaproteobacteria bacterium]|nr:prevent-host-death protein [Deltaproteobacteria bacterium]